MCVCCVCVCVCLFILCEIDIAGTRGRRGSLSNGIPALDDVEALYGEAKSNHVCSKGRKESLRLLVLKDGRTIDVAKASNEESDES